MIKTVSIVVLNKEGKILAVKRNSDKKYYPGEWDIISGKFHDNESSEECFLRELKEEIGHAEVMILKTASPYVYKEAGFSWLVYPFLCQINNNSINLNHEHTEFRWMRLEDFLSVDHAKPLEIELKVFFDIKTE